MTQATIENRVLKQAKFCPPGGVFHIQHIIFLDTWDGHETLSYKQVRDALFRIREWALIRHVGKGWYEWEV